MVLGRSSCPRSRLLALPESDRRRAAQGYDPAIAGRVFEHWRSPNMGPLLLLPEAIFLGTRQSALRTKSFDALRPGSLRISFQPRRASGSAGLEGSGLSRHEAHCGLADLGFTDSAVGQKTRRRGWVRALGLGP